MSNFLQVSYGEMVGCDNTDVSTRPHFQIIMLASCWIIIPSNASVGVRQHVRWLVDVLYH